MSTAEFIESELKVESDCPRDVTTVTCEETCVTEIGKVDLENNSSKNVFYMVVDSALDRDCFHSCV